MPKIFVQGEVGAQAELRRDAAHSLEMGDRHSDAIVCVLVSEGGGEPEFGSKIACEMMHEIVDWSENALQPLTEEMDYRLDPKRLLVELSARIVLIQMRYGDEEGDFPLHLAYLIAYKGQFVVLRAGEAKVLHVGADGSFEVEHDPTVDGSAVAQTALGASKEETYVASISYDFYLGTYEEGDLFLATTPRMWERLGGDGLTKAYANHNALDENSLSRLTADLICDTGGNEGAQGLTLAGAEMVSFTPYQKLGIKVS